MKGRREARDRRVVLDALAAAGPQGITPLGLAYLSDLPEARVKAALAHLEVDGLVVNSEEEGSGLPGSGRTRYRVRLIRSQQAAQEQRPPGP